MMDGAGLLYGIRQTLGSTGRRRVAAFVVLTAVLILALNLYAPANPSLPQRLMAGLLIALCSLPTLMWASDRQWHHSLMPFCGVLYALYFGAPVFLRGDFFGHWPDGLKIDDSLIDQALLLALAGWVLLLAGYFGPFHGWLDRKLPRINVLPGGTKRHALTLAVVLAVVGVPFFYLDQTAVLAFYAGRELLPPAVAFPVVLAGQLTVLSILILFHLKLRGELGLAGNLLLWGLVAYYTLFGFSTGLANHGLKAIFALFMAWAIAAPMPTWRGAGYAVLTAATLLLVVLPMRVEFRTLVWTHGVDPGGAWAHRLSASEFRLHAAGADSGQPLVETSDYDVTFRNGGLRYFFKDAEVCGVESVGPSELAFFVHLIPGDVRRLPDHRIQYGYDNLEFSLAADRFMADGGCIYEVPLPAYEIDRIRTGLFARARRTSKMKTLTRFVAGTHRGINADGEWQLMTLDASTWEIDPSTDGFRRRLLVAEVDELERAEMAGVLPGSVIRVEANADNWGDYRVSEVLVTSLRVTLRLHELVDSAGDRSALAHGASATLHYSLAEAGLTSRVVPATAYSEKLRGVGRNPYAPNVDMSLMRKTLLYMEMLSGFSGSGGVLHRLDSTAIRLDMLLPLAWVVRQTPENVAYLHGETYYPMLFKLVPRAVFKDKPRDVKDLGQRFGFLPEGNETNAFKVHQLGELYANFGTSGIVFGMFVLGALYRVIYQLFFHARASVVTLAAGSHVLTVLLVQMESLATVSWGFVLWYAVFLVLLNAGVRIGRRRGRF